MSATKNLTRRSLESAFEAQEKRLMAETMKSEMIRTRLKALIPLVANEVKGQAKREINGKIRALIQWSDGNAQFQFIKELDEKGPIKLVTRENWVIGIAAFIIGAVGTLLLIGFKATFWINGLGL